MRGFYPARVVQVRKCLASITPAAPAIQIPGPLAPQKSAVSMLRKNRATGSLNYFISVLLLVR